MPSSTPSPSLNLGCTDEAIRDNSQVNAVTVHTLLDKLVTMLDAVQENQHKMEQRQISLEGSVKGIQNDLTKLAKYQASTSSTVGKLLEKSRKVSAHTRAVRERMERQSAQVRRLESNHAQLLRRNHFKVLIFQVSVPCASAHAGWGPWTCMFSPSFTWVLPVPGSHAPGTVLWPPAAGQREISTQLRAFPPPLQPPAPRGCLWGEQGQSLPAQSSAGVQV